MITPSDLDSRRNKVLSLVIQVYVLTGHPVSSETLVRRFRLKLSPATIRHVLVDLEGLGHLHQPHTSGGRVPTDRGYRY